MLLKLTLQRGGPGSAGDDLLVEVDPNATAGGLADAIAERDPRRGASSGAAALTIRVEGPGSPRVLDPSRPVVDAALRSGDVVSLAPADGQFYDAGDERAPAATLLIVSGPGEGRRLPLLPGANQIGRGRDAEAVLEDPKVSKRHARINVTDVVEIVDLGSVNGVLIGDDPVDRVVLRVGDRVTLGDTVLALEAVTGVEAGTVTGPEIPFNRSPYLDPVYPGAEVRAPELPKQPQPMQFPLLVMIGPLLFGIIMYAFTRQVISLVFMGLSPMFMVGTFFESKRSSKRAIKEGTENFRDALARTDRSIIEHQAVEAAARRREHPATAEVVAAGIRRQPLLWARRPDRHSFLDLRIGIASLPTRVKVELPNTNDGIPGLWEELQETVAKRAKVPDVPVVGSFAQAGVIGVAGSLDDVLGAARALVAQVAALHSPAEVILGAMLSTEAAPHWDWLKWLPHATSAQSPIGSSLLAAGPQGAAALLASLRELVDERSGDEPTRVPAVVVVVDDAAPVDRSLLIELAERGPTVGVHLLWVSPAVELLPAAAKTYLSIDPRTHLAEVGFVDGGRLVLPVAHEPLAAGVALDLARSLAPVVDQGARSDDVSDLPARVSFVDQVGLEIADSSEAVVERWRLSDSLPLPDGESRPRRRAAALHALVGVGAHGPLQLDLRNHGPHALVGGTTGAGKSEFLQSWILGLAVNHSPHRVTFLFVDYKGGAAFSECVELPHSVGLVTDLTPHLVQRALASLDAELKRREHILNRRRAKDVLELERRHDPETPPSLVIVVDEFAALVAEVPEFVDGVVNVAQRGRSLGLHLILATQRPAGVIRDNLRANTNLRVALRMADEADSDDVVGSDIAATFSPELPGRGVAKLGPGRLQPFQAAYVGGWTTGEPPPAMITIASYAVGAVSEWPEPEPDLVAPAPTDEDLGPNDLERVVSAVTDAARHAEVPPPRRPWLPELAATYDLGRNPTDEDDLRLISRSDERLVFGVLDDPAHQEQAPVAFEPDRDGNMAVVGTGGSGKSAFLRTLAVAGALSTRSGPCHVYALDFASRGLDMVEELPNVGSVINGDDEERVVRLLRWLRATIDERLARYAAVRADTITQYRTLAGRPDEPRILLLLDGYPTFRQEYEGAGRLATYDLFQSIAGDGRQAGVHVVVAADRVGAIASTLSSVIQRRLVLRLAGENEYAAAGVPAAAFPTGTPPGRGFVDDYEVQVAVLGGRADTTHQAAVIARMADMARRSGTAEAPAIRRLPEEVPLADLPDESDGLPVLGIGDADLGPFGLPADGPILVVGPPKSGKTTALATIVQARDRALGRGLRIYVGEGRSPLASAIDWDERCVPGDDLEEELQRLRDRLQARPAASSAPTTLVVDDAPKVANWGTAADLVVELVEVVTAAGQLVVADGETTAMASSWGLLQTLKISRTGLALVPDQYDGDNIFKTPFPRVNRADFPPGRGFYVHSGRAHRVQVAQPLLGGA